MRGFFKNVIAGLAVAAIAGCSDSATSPSDATNGIRPSDRPSLDYTGPGRFGGFRTATFALTSSGGVFAIGDLYTLTVPANAVCVLGSSYGPGTWDSPCATLSAGQSIKVTATYGFAGGGPVVDFSPDIRFAPQVQVTLSTMLYAPVLTMFRSYFETIPSSLRLFGIYYTPDLGVTGIADAATAASLITHVNLKTGLVWRRIKHFSGYNVVNGQSCEPSPDDPNCIAGPAPVLERQ